MDARQQADLDRQNADGDARCTSPAGRTSGLALRFGCDCVLRVVGAGTLQREGAAECQQLAAAARYPAGVGRPVGGLPARRTFTTLPRPRVGRFSARCPGLRPLNLLWLESLSRVELGAVWVVAPGVLEVYETASLALPPSCVKSPVVVGPANGGRWCRGNSPPCTCRGCRRRLRKGRGRRFRGDGTYGGDATADPEDHPGHGPGCGGRSCGAR
jgi:hypothetical protein